MFAGNVNSWVNGMIGGWEYQHRHLAERPAVLAELFRMRRLDSG
jgi:hypothetical protein